MIKLRATRSSSRSALLLHGEALELHPPATSWTLENDFAFLGLPILDRIPLPNAAGYYPAKPDSHTSNRADYYKPFLVNYMFRVPIYPEATVFEIEFSKPRLA